MYILYIVFEDCFMSLDNSERMPNELKSSVRSQEVTVRCRPQTGTSA